VTTTTDNRTATPLNSSTNNHDVHVAQTATRLGLSGRARSVLVSAAAALFTAVPALAQRELTPPQPVAGEGKAPLIPALIAAICIALIIAVNLIPAKRGHQD